VALGEALYREITNGRSPYTEVSTVPGALRVLAADAGSMRALARSLDIAPSTLRGWFKGRTPRDDRSGLVQEAVAAQRRQRLPKGRERRMRARGLREVKVTGTYTYDGTGRGADEDREVDLGPYLDDVADELLDAYLDGADLDELEETFIDAISDGGGNGWYARTFQAGGWDIDDLDGWA